MPTVNPKTPSSKISSLSQEAAPFIPIFNRQKLVKISKKAIQKIVTHAIAFEGQKCDEVSVHFVSTKEICDLHLRFFDDPTTTDCISLPLDGPEEIHYRVLGEIFVCPETALEYANVKKIDSNLEIILYIVHGLLHLLGYDDMNRKEKRVMRSAEKRHLKELEARGLTKGIFTQYNQDAL